jgi:Secretion system C-terminal sorting domain
LAWTAAQSPTDPDSQPFGAQPSGCAVSQDDEAVFIINLGQSGLAVSPQSSGENLEKAGDFAVFPNPTDAFCNIELSQFLGKKLDIAVSDIFGKKVFFEKIAELKTATIDLDLSREMAGVYFIKIEAEGQRAVVKRLIISKL